MKRGLSDAPASYGDWSADERADRESEKGREMRAIDREVQLAIKDMIARLYGEDLRKKVDENMPRIFTGKDYEAAE